jgi:hypothetical protein
MRKITLLLIGTLISNCCVYGMDVLPLGEVPQCKTYQDLSALDGLFKLDGEVFLDHGASIEEFVNVLNITGRMTLSGGSHINIRTSPQADNLPRSAGATLEIGPNAQMTFIHGFASLSESIKVVGEVVLDPGASLVRWNNALDIVGPATWPDGWYIVIDKCPPEK